MTSPAKRITAALKDHADTIGGDTGYALDDMDGHALGQFFATLFEIDQRIQNERNEHE